jgi:hypothetical protein
MRWEVPWDENAIQQRELVKVTASVGARTVGRKPTGGWTQLINQQYFFIDINLI